MNEGNIIKEAIVPVIGVLLSLSIFFLAWYQKWKTGDGYIDKALLGDREALETVAYKLRNRRWVVRFYRKNTKRDIVHALCLGWTLDRLPPYTRALIFDTLLSLCRRNEFSYIFDEMERIEKKFTLYQRNYDKEAFKERLEKNSELLTKLKNAL